MTIRPERSGAITAELVVCGDFVVTEDDDDRVLVDGAVAVRGGVIIEVGPREELREHHREARWIEAPGSIVVPGYVDVHQHLTGDRLARSTIPDRLGPEQSIFEWAVPLHEAQRPNDEELSATLAIVDALRNGVTTIVEAGTVESYEHVAAAMAATGVRGFVSRWGWDRPGAPFAHRPSEVLRRQRELLERYEPTSGRVRGAVALVGHDLVSDELYAGAAALAREAGALLTFHISLTAEEAASFVARTGERALVHLDRLGVLGPNTLLAHAVHLDDAECDLVVERDAAIAYCPWTYFRLASGSVRAGRHLELARRGVRVGFGCDSENASDQLDLLRVAALACGLERDRSGSTTAYDAARALRAATRGGAEAVGLGGQVGALAVGWRADLVVHRPARLPRAGDPCLELVWGSDGRSVTHVVVDGRVLVDDGAVTSVDEMDLARAAERSRADLLARAGLDRGQKG